MLVGVRCCSSSMETRRPHCEHSYSTDSSMDPSAFACPGSQRGHLGRMRRWERGRTSKRPPGDGWLDASSDSPERTGRTDNTMGGNISVNHRGSRGPSSHISAPFDSAVRAGEPAIQPPARIVPAGAALAVKGLNRFSQVHRGAFESGRRVAVISGITATPTSGVVATLNSSPGPGTHLVLARANTATGRVRLILNKPAKRPAQFTFFVVDTPVGG